jgi:hypothetical protein
MRVALLEGNSSVGSASRETLGVRVGLARPVSLQLDSGAAQPSLSALSLITMSLTSGPKIVDRHRVSIAQ